jgi:hypothetical protein
LSTTTILAVSTPVVAIASFVFSYLSSSRDRRATRDLARDSRAHEIDVRRRERAYEARKKAYRTALEWALVSKQVVLTDPIMTFSVRLMPPRICPGGLRAAAGKRFLTLEHA